MPNRTEFTVYLLNEQGISAAAALADIFSEALDKIEAIVPAGRERSIVITKLQEASFFAKRAIAINPSLQKDS